MAQFQDLPYLDKSRASFFPRLSEEGNMIPNIFQVGLGVEVVSTRRINHPGKPLGNWKLELL